MSRKRTKQRKRTRRVRRHRQRGGGSRSQFFEDAYAITLDPGSQRYMDIKQFATAASIPLQPWKGVVITPKERDTLPEQGVGTTNFKDRTGATFNLGVIGAFLAHRALFKHVAETAPTKSGTLIFEDDVEIPADFYDKLAAVEKEVPADWDFIFLDKLYTVGKPVTEHVMKLDKDMTAMKNWGIWAYIVKNASLKDKILPKLEHMLDVPDIQLAKFADVLNMYLLQPSIVKQDARNAPNSVVTQLDKQRGGGSAVPLTHTSVKSPIKVFTSSDRMEPTLEELLKSLKKHHYSYEVLGMGKAWKGFKTKMENYLEGIDRYVAEKGPDALAIFIDAFDVYCIKDAEKVLQTYKSRNHTMPIVVGVEIYCFHRDNCDMDTLKWFDAHHLNGGSAAVRETLFKPDPTKDYYESPRPVFLNSGFIMGPAKDLQAMFKAMMESADTDDQLAVIHYMNKNPQKIDLDLDERLIRNKLKPREKLPDEDGNQGPGFVHFPGTRSKELQENNVNSYYASYKANTP